MVEGPCVSHARVADGDGDKLHPPPDLLEDHDEGGVFIDILRVFLVASEVLGEPNFYENEGA